MQIKLLLLAVTSTLTLLLTSSMTEGASIGDKDLANRDAPLDIEDEDLETRSVKVQTKRGVWDNYVPDFTSNSVLVRKRDTYDNKNLETRASDDQTKRGVLDNYVPDFTSNSGLVGKRDAKDNKDSETRTSEDQKKRGVWDNYVPDFTSNSVLVRKRDAKDYEDIERRALEVLYNGDLWHATEPVLIKTGVKLLSNYHITYSLIKGDYY